VTVPVGVTAPDAGVTVAVKLTLTPVVAEVGVAIRAVEVVTGTGLTVTINAAEVLGLKFVSPP